MMRNAAFRGKRAFLSNYHEAQFIIDGKIYNSVEHFFHASKADNEIEHEMVRNANTPAEAKKLGRSVHLRSDWEEEKINIMYLGLLAKFCCHLNLAIKLVETGDDTLEELNDWNDMFWGINIETREGQNMLGKLLMKVRTEIKQELLKVKNFI